MGKVTWDPAAFRRAGVVGREGSLVELQVDGDADSARALEALADAVDAANELLAAQEEAGIELYGLVGSVTPGPRGPVARFKECEPIAALHLYMDSLAGHLDSRGMSGRLVALDSKTEDRWWGNHTFGVLMAVLQLPVDVEGFTAAWKSAGACPRAHGRFESDATALRAGTSRLDWVLEAGDSVELTLGFTRTPCSRAEASALVLEHLRHSWQAGVRATDGLATMRSFGTGPFGDVSVWYYDAELNRTEHLRRLTGLLADLAPLLRGGWVQEADAAATSRRDLLTRIPPSHLLAERVSSSVWWLLHLEVDHVQDAFVAQVLNDAQLARTFDLDTARWRIARAAADRYLVVAQNPEPWLDADPTPLPQRPGYDNRARCSPIYPVDDDTLARARADFGDAIMTIDTLRERPFVELDTGDRFPTLEALSVISD